MTTLKNRNTLFVLHGMMLILILTGCFKELDPNEFGGTPTSRLVIQGMITDETKRHSVILSETKEAAGNDPAEKVSGASIEIIDGTLVYPLMESDTLPGVYLTDEDVTGEIGKTYTLTVVLDGEIYTASDRMVPVTPFGPGDELFEAPNRLDDDFPDHPEVFELQFAKVRYGTAAPSRQLLFAHDPIVNGLRQAIFYEFPRIDPHGFLLNFSGASPTLVIEEGSEIIQFKSSLSDEHYEFIRAVFAETQFRGGIFDVIPGNAPGNISNGGLGFFGASAVISRTLIVTEDNLDQ